MKNQYVGDIGDYGKYSLLRAFLSAGVKVGVNWYLTEDDSSNDGKSTEYLKNNDVFRWYDPDLFEALKRIATIKHKSVNDIEKSGMLPETIFYSELLVPTGTPTDRKDQRETWFDKSLNVLKSAELIFMDPDNGLLENGGASKLGAEKYILPEEVERYFKAGHDVVYYCHKGRRSYAAWDDYISLMFGRIPEAKPTVLTYHKGSQRSYVFLIHEENFKKYRKIIDNFKSRWARLFSEEYTNKGDTAGEEDGTISIEKSDGTKVTISKRADGQLAVRSSSKPNCTMVIPPDLFCSEIGV